MPARVSVMWGFGLCEVAVGGSAGWAAGRGACGAGLSDGGRGENGMPTSPRGRGIEAGGDGGGSGCSC